jgi:hypothetical protein
MDNTNDNSNNPEENAIEVAPPSEIELVEGTEETNEMTDTNSEETTTEENDMDETAENDSADEEKADFSEKTPSGLTRMELESLIQRYMDDVEKLKSQIKSEKEMYNASFENDAAYSEAEKNAKETKQKVSEIKQRITQQPAVKDAQARMVELKDEMKDVQDAISGLAEQYQQVAGTNQIVQDDGQVLEIVRNFKVIRKRG